VGVGTIKALLGLGILGLLPMLGYRLETARAATFHFMAIGQLFLTYPARHTWMRPLVNPYLHAAVLGGVAIQLLAASVPVVSNLLGNAAIPAELWVAVFGAAFVSWGLAEGVSQLVWRGHEADSSR
jgi:Ca2+-transporting ATPase